LAALRDLYCKSKLWFYFHSKAARAAFEPS
jgi:hypothetical protein